MSSAEPSSPDGIALPEMLRPLFWDCDFDQLEWPKHRDFIIGRVLAAGSWEAVGWLRTAVGDAELRDWIERHDGRGLSSKQLRFWQLILDIPAERVDRWLRRPGRTLWEGRRDR